MRSVVTVRPRSVRRLVISWAMAVVGLPVGVAALSAADDWIDLTSALLGTLTLVLAVALIGGRLVGAVAAVIGSLLVNWFFVEPVRTMSISDTEHLVALVVFVLVAIVVGSLVDLAARRAAEAKRARDEAELLARSTGTLVGDAEPLAGLLDTIRTVFALDAAVLSPTGVVSGTPSGRPSTTIPVPGDLADPPGRLELYGSELSPDDRRVLRVLVAQLGLAEDSRRLAEQAARARVLAETEAVRTGLLRAVSHDLRTPLASIKAMASGVRDTSVRWSDDQLATALATIEEEADRLDRLVGNLLDASRIESGAVVVDRRESDLAEVIGAALDGLRPDVGQVVVDLPAGLPSVWSDPALLERSLANVLANALRFTPEGTPVTVRARQAGEVGERVEVEVVDHGPGVAPHDRTRVTAPFQRLGDQRNTDGVGLGLSIASGFVDAMGGRFEFADTDGGGLTVRIVLPTTARAGT